MAQCRTVSLVSLVVLCLSGLAHADPPRGAQKTLWRILTPAPGTVFAVDSPIACTGSAEGANLSFAVYVYDGEVVASSATGTTTSNKDWSVTVPCPAMGWNRGHTLEIRLYYQGGEPKDRVEVKVAN